MSGLSAVKQALIEIERLQEEVAALRQSRAEPLAIVGLSCRFPGDAAGPEAFWSLLAEGRDAIAEVPRERWDIEALYDPDPARRGRIASRWGGFLRDIDRFDAEFFGIAPREAAAMDPQQRVLLEVVWEALERAGLSVESLAGTTTAVYTGVCSADYERLHYRDRDAVDIYSLTGTAANLLAGRLAYVFDWHGPAVTLDTACSSSLVAVHFACQSLRARECDVAVAAGVNLFVLPERHIGISRMRMLAADGRCKTFDARADGFVRSEGCGVVVLKRLGDALASGDPVLALVKGSAVNQDGRSAGLTAPNGAAQHAVIREALDRAGLRPDDVDFIEAHGAATSLGDPVEVEALASLYGQPAPSPCVLGAVKTNIGHAEAAAGIAGLIKAVLALQHERIPKNLHFERVNPNLPLDGTRLEIAAESRPWPRGARLRRAGVSSFGWSGTNAHVVLEEAPAADVPALATRASYVLPVSARAPAALREMTARYAECLERGSLGDIVFTAGARRSHHRHRVAVVGRSGSEIAAALRASDAAGAGDSGQPVLVYGGQGGQWAGMGAEFFDTEPVFRRVVEECDAAIRAHAGWSLIDALRSSAPWQEIDRVQPALLAIGAGLTAVWRHWGVQPAIVVGHSLGEVIAAHAAGILSLADAVDVMCVRSGLLKRIRGRGAMAVVELGRAAAERSLSSSGGRVVVAASNSERSTVVAGDTATLEALMDGWERGGIHCRRVQVDVASHSPEVDDLLDELKERLRNVRPRNGATRMISTVTGEPVTGDQLDASYWVRNLREPVRFGDVMRRLVGDGRRSFVEIGPHPTLGAAILDTLGQIGGVALPSLRRGEPARDVMLRSAAALYGGGADLNWSHVNGTPGSCTVLPAYAWQRERHWLDTPAERAAPRPGWVSVAGERDVHVWEFEAEPGHAVLGRHVMPAAAYLERAIAGSRDVFGPSARELRDVRFTTALDAARPAQLVIRETDEGMRFDVSSRVDGEPRWQTHASGRLVDVPSRETEPIDLGAIRARCARPVDAAAFYRRFSDRGVEWSASQRPVLDAWIGSGEALTRLDRPNLDGCLQALGWAGDETDDLRVPVGAARAALGDAASAATWAWARWRHGLGHVIAAAGDGRIVADIEGVQLVRLAAHADDWLWELQWQEADPPAPRRLAGRWRVVANDDTLIQRLRDRGASAERVASARASLAADTCSGIVWMAERGDVERVVDLVQTLEQLGARELPRLALVTRGTQSAGGGARSVDGAELWGLVQVIRHEFAALQVLCVDLPAEPDDAALDALAHEVAASSPETHVALRGAQRYVARLTRVRPPAIAPATLSGDATYVMTGGQGGLGLAVAARLVEQGARHLALISRSGPSGEAARRLDALGADVHLFRADVGVRDQIEPVLAEIARSMPPVRGIIHAAGVLDEVTLLHVTPERLAAVMRPKAAGAWHLHELTADWPLDFFVLFSSAAAILGGSGLGAYAAANASLDSLAHVRRAQKRPALSINWGRWSDVGLAADQAHGQRLQAQGIRPMPPADALDLLTLLIASDRTHVAAMAFDFRQWSERCPAAAALPLFVGLDAHPVRSGATPLGAALAEMSRPDAAQAVVAVVRAQAERVMHVAAGTLPDGMSLFDRGLDSMTALEIRNSLEDRLGLRIPATALWRHPTPSALAAYLVDELVPPERSDEADPDGSLARILAEAARLDVSPRGWR